MEDFDVIDFLQQMTVRCRELLDAADAAVFLAHPGPGLHSPVPCDPRPALQAVLDTACRQGPAIDAHRTTRPVTAHLQDDAAVRWPQFTPLLRQAGYIQATALPMRLRRDGIGSLPLLRTGDCALTVEDHALAQAFSRTPRPSASPTPAPSPGTTSCTSNSTPPRRAASSSSSQVDPRRPPQHHP
ncbi:GAF domain-containing protein [Streptomyces sp. NPDC047070]|uniref:GAF domain-containing protein n=1 Tax=Streptomyces sp. NPDC047070 TaxID=3154923 RepID=UPI003452EE7C